jgi:hypothetical protein
MTDVAPLAARDHPIRLTVCSRRPGDLAVRHLAVRFVCFMRARLSADRLTAGLPVPESVVDGAEFDVWGQLRPVLGEAIAQTLDAAVFARTSGRRGRRPVVRAATAAGHTLEIGTASAAQGGVLADIEAPLDDVGLLLDVLAP